MSRTLIVIGVILVLTGLAWPLLAKLGFGRLPGDIVMEGERGSFYFPIVTCLLISGLLSCLLWLFGR